MVTITKHIHFTFQLACHMALPPVIDFPTDQRHLDNQYRIHILDTERNHVERQPICLSTVKHFCVQSSTFTLLSVSAKGRVVYSRISCAVGNKELSCLALGLKAFARYVKDRHGVSEAF